jgi:hypothetical protein
MPVNFFFSFSSPSVNLVGDSWIRVKYNLSIYKKSVTDVAFYFPASKHGSAEHVSYTQCHLIISDWLLLCRGLEWFHLAQDGQKWPSSSYELSGFMNNGNFTTLLCHVAYSLLYFTPRITAPTVPTHLVHAHEKLLAHVTLWPLHVC